MRLLTALLSTLTLATGLIAQAPPRPAAPKAPPAAPKAPAPPADKDVPRKAGEFVIHMQTGEKLLSTYHGKVVVMAFMYTTCPHCQHTAGVLAKIQTEYANKGVQILGTVFDENAKRDAQKFVSVTGANFPVGYSTTDQVMKFMHAEEGFYVPMLAFIDRTGTMRRRVISNGDGNDDGTKFLEDQENAIRREIDALLKGAPAASKPAPKQ